MKFLKLQSLFLPLLLIIGITTMSSCSKDADSNEGHKGTFSITINGTEHKGSTVDYATAVGITTISAEKSSFVIAIIINDDKFKVGSTLNVEDILSTLNVIDLEGLEKGPAILKSGDVKIISKSKIEIKNAVFQGYNTDLTEINVSGTISW